MVACLKCFISPKNEILAHHGCECFGYFRTNVFSLVRFFFRFQAKLKSLWLLLNILPKTQNERHIIQ